MCSQLNLRSQRKKCSAGIKFIQNENRQRAVDTMCW